MNTKEDILNNIVSPLSVNMSTLAMANAQLTFSLAKHLIEKKVISLDEYLDSNKATEEALKSDALLIKDSGGNEELVELHIDYIEMVFEAHRNELAKL